MFEGTFEECLDKIRQGSREDLRKLREFTGVSLETAAMWLFGSAPQRLSGDMWMRCVVFFRLQQWRVTDFDDSDPLKVAIAEAIALGLAGHLDLLEEAGYARKRSSSPLHSFVYGGRQLFKRAKLEAFLALKAAALEELRNEAAERYRLCSLDEDVSITSVMLNLRQRSREMLAGDSVAQAAALLAAAAPLVQTICEDKTNEGALARQELRELVGPEVYSNLSVHLNMMRSRMAYERAQRGEVN